MCKKGSNLAVVVLLFANKYHEYGSDGRWEFSYTAGVASLAPLASHRTATQCLSIIEVIKLSVENQDSHAKMGVNSQCVQPLCLPAWEGDNTDPGLGGSSSYFNRCTVMRSN